MGRIAAAALKSQSVENVHFVRGEPGLSSSLSNSVASSRPKRSVTGQAPNVLDLKCNRTITSMLPSIYKEKKPWPKLQNKAQSRRHLFEDVQLTAQSPDKHVNNQSFDFTHGHRSDLGVHDLLDPAAPDEDDEMRFENMQMSREPQPVDARVAEIKAADRLRPADAAMPCQTENTPSFNEKVLQIAYQPEQAFQKEHQISKFAPTAKLQIPISNSFISNTKSSISYLTRPSHIEVESERQQDIEKR